MKRALLCLSVLSCLLLPALGQAKVKNKGNFGIAGWLV